MFDPCDQEKYMDTEYGLVEESSEFVVLSNLKIVIELWISLPKKLLWFQYFYHLRISQTFPISR